MGDQTITSRPRANRPLRYRDAGVDIDAGAALIDAIAPFARTTARPGADGALGGFGGLFDLKAAGFRDPILVAATDGVGTKLRVAIEAGRHQTIGIDLVAMCVNDLVVQGAEPLFFLDYYATGRLDPAIAEEVISGIITGCRQVGCTLIGGETAEMPGMYRAGDYDLAGFAVGAAERGTLLDGQAGAAGDVILGFASDGLHANGFSLVRRVVEATGLSYDDPAPFAPEQSLAEALLRPTRLYVHSCLSAHQVGAIKGFAHITGGGLIDNPPRSFPDTLAARIDTDAWPLPAVFAWLAETGGIEAGELARTFNCGIGMIAIVAADGAEIIAETLRATGETVYVIGRLVERGDGDPPVRLDGLHHWPG